MIPVPQQIKQPVSNNFTVSPHTVNNKGDGWTIKKTTAAQPTSYRQMKQANNKTQSNAWFSRPQRKVTKVQVESAKVIDLMEGNEIAADVEMTSQTGDESPEPMTNSAKNSAKKASDAKSKVQRKKKEPTPKSAVKFHLP